METEADAEANVAPSAVGDAIEGTEGNKEAVQNNNEASGEVHDPNGRMLGNYRQKHQPHQ